MASSWVVAQDETEYSLVLPCPLTPPSALGLSSSVPVPVPVATSSLGRVFTLSIWTAGGFPDSELVPSDVEEGVSGTEAGVSGTEEGVSGIEEGVSGIEEGVSGSDTAVLSSAGGRVGTSESPREK